MKRDVTSLANNNYDVVVIGGGIYGACVAWEATLRGLSVALVEKRDFGHATSANSLKIVHGGLRYLQHADFRRMRESIRERRTLMHIAPHLVHPLPCLMPTYGHGLRGKEALTLALLVNDLISFDRNRLNDPQKYLPRGQIISRADCLELLPGVETTDLTGGAIWYDGQMYNSERLTLSFVRSAALAGANVANYVEAVGFLQQDNRVSGVTARDVLTDEQFDIRAELTINTAGPWLGHVAGMADGSRPAVKPQLAQSINLVTRQLFDTYAVGLRTKSEYKDDDAVFNTGSRLLFITPWRDYSIVGTTYSAYRGHPDEFDVTEQDVATLLNEINAAYPPAQLTYEDVKFVHKGMVPISDVDSETGSVQRAKQYEIHDHRQDGIYGLLSVLGVKYTTARGVAERVVDTAFTLLGHHPPPSRSAEVPLHDGNIARFEDYVDRAVQRRPLDVDEELITNLVYNYGTMYTDILHEVKSCNTGHDVSRLDVIEAQVRYALHEEMAQTLSDVIFRRTDLGSAGNPGDDVLQYCLQTMRDEMDWTHTEARKQLQQVYNRFSWHSRTEKKEVAPWDELLLAQP